MKIKIILAIAMLLSISAAFLVGKTIGVAQMRAEIAESEIIALKTSFNNEISGFIDSTRELTQQANRASVSLASSIHARQRADEESTNAIKEALHATAAERSNCQFDANVMQQLNDARTRANESTHNKLNPDAIIIGTGSNKNPVSKPKSTERK